MDLMGDPLDYIDQQFDDEVGDDQDEQQQLGDGGVINMGYDDVDETDGLPPIVQPREQQFERSYANAHHSQRNAGRVRAARPRAVEPLAVRRQREAEKKEAADRKAAAVARAAKRISGKALVALVQSGDSIWLQGNAGKSRTPPPMKQVTLSGISAPRLGRRNGEDDEPFAWEAREFLRQHILGKVVDFQINHVHEESGREYGDIKLDGESMAALLVGAGLANAKPGAPKKDGTFHPERQALLDLEEKAKSEGLGVHADDKTKARHVRKTTEADGFVLWEECKVNGPIPGVVEFVREGSFVRVEMPGSDGHHRIAMVHLAGIQAPRVPMSWIKYDNAIRAGKGASQPSEKAEPFGLDARHFIRTRLLQRSVGVNVVGVDKTGNIFCTLEHPNGSITVELVKNGLARIVPWTFRMLPQQDQAAIRAAEDYARSKKLRLFKNAPPAERKSGDGSYQMQCKQVLSGDSIVLVDSAGRESNVRLASLSAPKLGAARKNIPDQPWAWEAKEFLRKKLVGRSVKVFPEYTRTFDKDQKREFVSVLQGKLNVGEALVKSGLAKVVKHRVDEPRSSFYDLYVLAEKKAETSKAGVHGAHPPKRDILDLTERFRPDSAKDAAKKEALQNKQLQVNAKAHGLMSSLKQAKDIRGVVEHVFSGARLKLYLPKHSAMITLMLGGVRCPAPAKKDEKQTTENWGLRATAFTRELCIQHDVRVKVDDLDKNGNFIGTVMLNDNTNLALSLLENGLASVFGFSAEKSQFRDALFATEERAKKAKIGLWKDWKPPVKEKKEEKKEVEAKEYNNKEVSVTVTEIVDATNFFVHIIGNQALQHIEEHMRQFGEESDKAEKVEPKKGVICAGLFTDGQWYRVRVDKRTSDDTWRVSFIDYGNSEDLHKDQLRAIKDASVLKPAPLACPCVLAGIKGPSQTNDHFQTAFDFFTDAAYDRQLLGKVHYREAGGKLHLELFGEGSDVSVNRQMLRNGLARIASRPNPRKLAQEFAKDEQYAKLKHLFIWEYGDVSDEDEEANAKAAADAKKAADGTTAAAAGAASK